jgi:hypothetical protein
MLAILPVQVSAGGPGAESGIDAQSRSFTFLYGIRVYAQCLFDARGHRPAEPRGVEAFSVAA